MEGEEVFLYNFKYIGYLMEKTVLEICRKRKETFHPYEIYYLPRKIYNPR